MVVIQQDGIKGFAGMRGEMENLDKDGYSFHIKLTIQINGGQAQIMNESSEWMRVFLPI